MTTRLRTSTSPPRLPRVVLSVALLAGALSACSKDETIRAEPNDSGVGDGGVGGAAGSVACATGLPGPVLVRIDTTDGATYCMDQREVTWGEYQAFSSKKGADTSGQPPECAWNTSYWPQYWDPSDDTHVGYKCPAGTPYPADDAAANCVDFCDADAYCAWAGKRLCGRVGGPKKWGRVDIVVSEDAGPLGPQWDAAQKIVASTAMEFQHACTQGGKTTFPYGNQYQAGTCIDAAWVAAKGSKSLGVVDLSNRACHGTEPPFDAIYDLSAGVREWQNFCAVTGGLVCHTIGGSSDPYESTHLGCADNPGVGSAQQVDPYIGFRCCADPVPAP